MPVQRIVLVTTTSDDLSNGNPARGHKEVGRSTGHIMVTNLYTKIDRDPNRDKTLDWSNHSTTTGNVSASRRKTNPSSRGHKDAKKLNGSVGIQNATRSLPGPNHLRTPETYLRQDHVVFGYELNCSVYCLEC